MLYLIWNQEKMNLHYSAFQLILNGMCRNTFNSIFSHDRKTENGCDFFSD